MSASQPNNKILLHICCAGCGAFVSQLLASDYEVVPFYYNPNIFPANEYWQRAAEIKKIAQQFKLEIIIVDYDHESWLKKIAGHENDEERGERCWLCYRDRLQATATAARTRGILNFTSTLTVSPHKLAWVINKIGQELASEYNLNFLEKDFKKQDGFKKAAVLSRELGLYRQDYCGCEFSQRPKIKVDC
ncbi:MAG: epoxyqueuosine reductase QueH [Candidatus Falkowbacteria bacterium]|nr:epoxyqueuosine reductase QueH [Candidatus Falkowbacteria bacterium]